MGGVGSYHMVLQFNGRFFAGNCCLLVLGSNCTDKQGRHFNEIACET
jgi:hypothetical protein